jgi:hypothetical protein
MQRLLITGTRHGWEDNDLVRALHWAYWELAAPPQHVLLVHGDARGVDQQAAAYWEAWDMPTEPHPADWANYPNTAGPLRNSEMVALGADLCLAFPSLASKGTYDTMKKARDAGIRVVDWSEIGDLT